MPDIIQVEATILAAKYKLATLVDSNVVLISNGGVPVNDNYINYFNLNLQGLIYQDINKDYTSSTTNILYTRLNGLIGIPTTAQVNPGFQSQNIVINVTQNGSQAINHTYTQADLLDAGGGNWYLPYNLDATTIPLLLTINNVSTAFTFDETVIPSRVYGFASNSTQTIVLTVISTT